MEKHWKNIAIQAQVIPGLPQGKRARLPRYVLTTGERITALDCFEDPRNATHKISLLTLQDRLGKLGVRDPETLFSPRVARKQVLRRA